LRIAHDANDEHQIAWQGGTLGAAWIFEGDFLKAGAVLDGLSSNGQLPSDLFYGYRAWSNWFLGRWRMAVADCAMVQALNPGAPAASIAWALSLAGLLQAAMGAPADAGPYLAQADRIFRGGDLYWCSGVNDWAAGCTLWFCNDPEGGLERLDRAARRLEEIGALSLATQVSLDLVDVLVTLGEMTHADLVAGRIESLSGNLGTPFASAQASYGRGVVLARRRAAAAEPLLRAAAAGADKAGAAWIRARALEHLATVLEGSERISVLSEATRLYSTFPARAHEGRALAALRAMGPAGRRAAQAVGELTIRETEVVRLAKRGLNTREIAGNLHVSERTVETHLAHIYRKLGVSGRKELLVVGPGQPGEPGLVRSPPASPSG
jgi:DNA-binding CsgD family transcriptional regulator